MASGPTFSCRPAMQVNGASHEWYVTYSSSSGGTQCPVPFPAPTRLLPAAMPSSSPAIRPTSQYLNKFVFCCSSYRPYLPTHTDEENKFDTFLSWVQGRGPSNLSDGQNYVIQAVKQINCGPVEEIRYYWRTTGGFEEVTEEFVRSRALKKKNTYKNFKCTVHNKIFEINLYQENPFSKHTWRRNPIRPASTIDISY